MDTKTTFFSDTLTLLRSYKHSELKAIALASDVPEGTVRKLYYGEVKNPRINTIEALHNYFASRPTKGAEHA